MPLVAMDKVSLLISAIGLLTAVWMMTKTEMRGDGFLKASNLIRWKSIASWKWENIEEDGPISTPGPIQDPTLCLHLLAPIGFLTDVSIKIPKSKKSEVEANLLLHTCQA